MDPKAEKTIIPDSAQNKALGLRKEIDKAIAHYAYYARANYGLALFSALMLIAASMAGLIGGLVFKLSPEVLGSIAAIPTIIAFAPSVYNPQQRANWHFAKKDRLNALRRKLLYTLPPSPSDADVGAISDAWETIDKEMNTIWENGLGLDLTKGLGKPA